MSISEPFIRRPIGTTLLTLGFIRAGRGGLAFYTSAGLPLPQVDYPTISVGASLPGASPQTMAAVGRHAAGTPVRPHRRRHGDDLQSSNLGTTSVTLQFDLSRDIDGAARDVEAAINAARGNLPSDLPAIPATARSTRPTRRS